MSRLVLLLLLLTGLARAAEPSPIDPKQALDRQLELITQVEPQVETYDLPRLIYLRAVTTRAREALLDKNRGPLHRETAREFYNLVIGYRYSKSFFEQIESEDTAPGFEELFAIANKLAEAYGLDDSATQISASSFTQLHKLLLQLLDMDLSPDLRKRLEDLKVPLGHALGVASLGDRYKTFQAAIPICKSLRALYPLFAKVRPADAAYNVILEIQGLNETYVDYAQIEDELKK